MCPAPMEGSSSAHVACFAERDWQERRQGRASAMDCRSEQAHLQSLYDSVQRQVVSPEHSGAPWERSAGLPRDWHKYIRAHKTDCI